MTIIRTLSFAVLFALSAAAQAAPELVDGEIRKVDKDAAKLTIKHGELKELGMMPMTMVFRVKDKAMLDQVKAGDKVRIAVEKVDGALTVTTLQAVKP
jgi:Cu(I)/Ag(I) efflux system protein CusF